MKQDALVAGTLILVTGIVWMAFSGLAYVNNAASANQICSSGGYGTVACSTAEAQSSLGIFWVLAGIGVFLIGLWGLMRACLGGEDVVFVKAVPPGHV
jgi:hypothetical protein